MKIFILSTALLLGFVGNTKSELIAIPPEDLDLANTNQFSDAEMQGYNLARHILNQIPDKSFQQTGVIVVRNGHNNSYRMPLKFDAAQMNDSGSWVCMYVVKTVETNSILEEERLTVLHSINRYNHYLYSTYSNTNIFDTNSEPTGFDRRLYGNESMIPFAGSDFWLGDLGLEFLHWPGQKILRGDTARMRLCKVLESTNPNPSTNGYSRVDSWIDNETLGIVEARAYDANGKLLKEFYPKDFKKDVNGQWQVGSMEIDNVQTRSRTQLVFDLKAK
jgi:hypothetical protein